MTRIKELLLDGSFLKYYSASVISAVGDGLSTLAVPAIAVILLHADSVELGVLNALQFLPALLISVPVGAWVGATVRQRDMMLLANIGSFLAFSSIPLCRLFGVLYFPQLCVAIFVAGAFSVLFVVCDNSLFVKLVSPDKHVVAQSMLFGSFAVAALLGPGLGGLLIQVFSASNAPLFDASTYLISAILLCLISRSRLPAHRDSATNSSIRESLGFLRRNQAVRAVLSVTAAANFFNYAFQALQVLYLVDTVGASVQFVGLLLTSVALGGLLGSVLATPITAKVGSAVCLTLGSVLIAAPLAAVVLVRHIDAVTSVVLIVAMAGSGLGRVWQNVSAALIFTASVPDSLRSQTRGAFQMVSTGVRPLGALLGGLLGSEIGLRPTLWLAVIGGMLFSIVTAPKRSAREAQHPIGVVTDE